jgi:hypothetical protein
MGSLLGAWACQLPARGRALGGFDAFWGKSSKWQGGSTISRATDMWPKRTEQIVVLNMISIRNSGSFGDMDAHHVTSPSQKRPVLTTGEGFVGSCYAMQ